MSGVLMCAARSDRLLSKTIKISGDIANILSFIRHPFDKKNPVAKEVASHIQKDLIAHGVKPKAAAKAAAAVTPLVGQAVKNDFELAGKEMLAPFVLTEKAPALIAAELANMCTRRRPIPRGMRPLFARASQRIP